MRPRHWTSPSQVVGAARDPVLAMLAFPIGTLDMREHGVEVGPNGLELTADLLDGGHGPMVRVATRPMQWTSGDVDEAAGERVERIPVAAAGDRGTLPS